MQSPKCFLTVNLKKRRKKERRAGGKEEERQENLYFLKLFKKKYEINQIYQEVINIDGV